MRCWVKRQYILPRTRGQGKTRASGKPGHRAEQRVLSARTPARSSLTEARACGAWRAVGKLPKRFTLSLAHQFLDLMRSHRKEQKEPGLLIRRTVYLINCIFMIKSKTLRGQGAKDMGWI